MYADGGLLGKRNPSPEGVYWSVYSDPPGHIVVHHSSTIHHTNNEAEWLALQAAFTYAVTHYPKATSVTVHSDSQLIVNIFNNCWRANDPKMIRMWRDCARIASQVKNWQVRWCPRKVIVAYVGH